MRKKTGHMNINLGIQKPSVRYQKRNGPSFVTWNGRKKKTVNARIITAEGRLNIFQIYAPHQGKPREEKT